MTYADGEHMRRMRDAVCPQEEDEALAQVLFGHLPFRMVGRRTRSHGLLPRVARAEIVAATRKAPAHEGTPSAEGILDEAREQLGRIAARM